MSHNRLISILGFSVLAACAAPKHATSGEKVSGFAVVELFTSEGCSSCPPADALLGDLVKQAETDHLPIYPLAFHVDYWNQLGWVDRLSDPKFSRRQEAYAAVTHTEEVYTPQMIVNGDHGFVGSDRQEAQDRIDSALRQASKVGLTLASAWDGQSWSIHYAVEPRPEGATINFAIVEQGVVHSIARGENSGRVLRHENVVRAFRTIDLAATAGDVKLSPPPGADVKQLSLISLVQLKQNLSIVAAGQIRLPVEKSK